MARGMANNEKIVSQASTPEYESALDRIFGANRSPQRGRWIWDETLKKLVRAEDYHPQSLARNADIVMDRHYENTSATDGSDIGSRRKHQAYMKARGLTTADDFKSQWAKQAEKREGVKEGRLPDPRRREALERAMYQLHKP